MTENKENQTVKIRRGNIVHTINPFGVEALNHNRKVITNYEGDKLIVLDENTGEIKPAGFYTRKKVDNEQFVKVFIKGIRAFAELSSSATKLFEVFYIEIQNNPNKDKVYVDYQMVETLGLMKQSSYSRSIKELIEKQFIARTDKENWYFINPNFVWNGDRLIFAQEYEKVSKEEYEKEQLKMIENKNQQNLF